MNATSGHPRKDAVDAIEPEAIQTKRKSRSDAVIDGRTARRNRNKIAVLDALIALARDGNDEPPIELIAERAGVSYRSVYRYFDDRTDLMLAAIGRLMDDVWPVLAADNSGNGTLDERIAAVVDSRIAIYRKLAPLTRVAVQRRAHEPVVAEHYDRVRVLLRAYLATQFEPELSRLPDVERSLVLSSIDVAFQFEALDYLAGNGEMTDAQLGKLLTHQVNAQLGLGAAARR